MAYLLQLLQKELYTTALTPGWSQQPGTVHEKANERE